MCVTAINDRFSVITPFPQSISFPVDRVFSSTLLPGFIGPASLVLPVNLPPSVPPQALGSPSAGVFYDARGGSRSVSTGGLPWVRCITSPYPVRLHDQGLFCLPWLRPNIGTRFFKTARPVLDRHLAGSLFAAYTGSASCFLRTSRFRQCPCLVGVVLPFGSGGLLLPPFCLRIEVRRMHHARRTLISRSGFRAVPGSNF
jgi:hypothetical protein